MLVKKLRLQEWVASEAQEQALVFEWASLMEPRYPTLKLLVASMNGILTDVKFGAQLKRLGRKPGVPDMFLPVASLGFHGLFIELKRRGKSRVSAAQEWWHEQVRVQGYAVVVAYGHSEAIAALRHYLTISES